MRCITCKQPTLNRQQSYDLKLNNIETNINLEPQIYSLSRYPYWMDKDGTIYSYGSSSLIAKSTDFGQTWTNITDMIYTGTPQGMMVSDTGRIICWNTAGQVYISGENKTAPLTLAYTFTYGYTGFTFGFHKYKNILLLSSYGTKQSDGSISPRYVILSIDDGATWSQIFEDNQDANTHIHDVAYDPWDNRIWVSGGDDVRRVVYSDDMGLTWHYVYTSATAHVSRIQPTQIIPFPNCVIFGMDTVTNGLAVWHKPSTYQSTVRETEIFLQFVKFEDAGTNMRVLANKATYFDYGGERIVLIPFASDTLRLGFSRILASKDGLVWYQIWRDSVVGNEIQWLTGPFPGDPTRTVVGNYYIANPASSKLIKFRLPDIL